MRSPPAEPGLYFEVARPRPQPSPVRSDVAGLIVRTRRGPIGRSIRVEGWRQCRRVFGGLVAGAMGPYSMRGYFENGGEVAHVWRAAGSAVARAEAVWNIDPIVASRGGFQSTRYRWVASSPGTWGNGMTVSARYRMRGRLGGPEIDVVVAAPDEPTETFRAIPPERLIEVINPSEEDPSSGSALVRLVADDSPPPPTAAAGPSLLEWRAEDFPFGHGADDPPSAVDYRVGFQALLDEPEVAILAAPDLLGDLPALDVDEVVVGAVGAIDLMHDRLLLLDIPSASVESVADPASALSWLTALRTNNPGRPLRNVSVWHPPLDVPDPLGGAALPLKLVPRPGMSRAS